MDKVNICGHEYRIEFVDMDGDHLGQCFSEERIIRVRPNQLRPNDTILHEILHAILHESGVRSLIRQREEEAIVVALENGLLSTGLIKEF